MKTDIVVSDKEIEVSPGFVDHLLKARRNRSVPIQHDEGDGFDASLWEEYVQPKPRVWLGCTEPMPNGGQCFNAPIGKGLCYLHTIAKFITDQRQCLTNPE